VLRGIGKCAAALWLAATPGVMPGGRALAQAQRADTNREPWREIWAGAIASPQLWSAYSGATFAPFGSVRRDGFRFRSVGGYGQYRYSYVSSARQHAFKGAAPFSDLLVGYQQTLGPATIKALIGGSASGHLLSSQDPFNRVQGLDYGLKVGLETWVNIGAKAYSQLDGSWAAAFRSTNVRMRMGYRAFDDLSLGIELAASDNLQLHSEWLADKPWRGGSGGAFVRYEWETGEVSLSGGLASQGGGAAAVSGVNVGAGLGSIAKPTAPYATVNWLTRF
jgi:hypothetical protein